MVANTLFLRAAFAFLALPGVVALGMPWMMGRGSTFRPAGFAALLPGLALLLWCVREFHVAGRGTLAPWSPPVHLVRTGLYRHTRNPMYVAVLVMLAGWAIGFGSRGHWAYGPRSRWRSTCAWSTSRNPGSRARMATRGANTRHACRAGSRSPIGARLLAPEDGRSRFRA